MISVNVLALLASLTSSSIAADDNMTADQLKAWCAANEDLYSRLAARVTNGGELTDDQNDFLNTYSNKCMRNQ